VGLERHLPLPTVRSIVLPSKGDAIVMHADEAELEMALRWA